MSKTPKARKQLDVTSNKPTGWTAVLADAEGQLKEAQKRVKDLKVAVRIFRQRVENNAPFPAEGIADATQ